MSTIGDCIKIIVFGESHGPAIGISIDGLPSGEQIDFDRVREDMARRAPGDSAIGTARSEKDEPRVLSGILGDRTTGMPVCAVIENTNTRPGDYSGFKNIPRPGHADLTAQLKYGFTDLSGGGHFSGRLTAPIVFAGALCRQILERRGIAAAGHVLKLGSITDSRFDAVDDEKDLLLRLSREVFPVIDAERKDLMLKEIDAVKKERDSLGGVIEFKASGLPAGLGGPLFEGLEGVVSSYVFGIPAVKGIEFGAGFAISDKKGSESNDAFYMDGDRVKTKTNNMGGILGGITNGMPFIFRAAMKPTSSIARVQQSVDLEKGCDAALEVKGRHDSCVVPRAVPAIEAAALLALTDQMIKAGKL